MRGPRSSLAVVSSGSCWPRRRGRDETALDRPDGELADVARTRERPVRLDRHRDRVPVGDGLRPSAPPGEASRLSRGRDLEVDLLRQRRDSGVVQGAFQEHAVFGRALDASVGTASIATVSSPAATADGMRFIVPRFVVGSHGATRCDYDRCGRFSRGIDAATWSSVATSRRARD